MSEVVVQSAARTSTQHWRIWAGRIISIAPVAIVLSSSFWKLTHNAWYVREWARIGWQEPMLPYIATLQLIAIGFYVIPQTAVLGAVLLTGYLGGAIASYVRIGELTPPLVPLTTALLAWGGIYLRDERLWSLLPVRILRRKPTARG